MAQLMAGLIALLNEQNKKLSGFIHPTIHANPGLCCDITSGDNKTTSRARITLPDLVGMHVRDWAYCRS